jgi:hypothetical protein
MNGRSVFLPAMPAIPAAIKLTASDVFKEKHTSDAFLIQAFA